MTAIRTESHVRMSSRLDKSWNVAAAYAELKRSLAAAVGGDRHAYMTAKGDFITRVTAIAMGEQGSTG